MTNSRPSDSEQNQSSLAPTGFRAMLHVFRSRNFRIYFCGQFMSLLGTWLQNVALGWLVYDLTHSPFLLGLATFMQQGPMFFLAAFAGTVIDRVGRRRMMALTQALFCIQSIVLAVLTLSGSITVEIILTLSLLYGLVNAFDAPVRHGFVYDLVGPEQLKSAIAVNAMQFNIARMFGPGIAGVLIVLIGEGGCFAINSVSFAFTLGVLYLLRLPPHEARAYRNPIDEIMDAVRYVLSEPVMRTTLLMLALSSTFGGAYLGLMPAFARDVVHVDPRGFGVLMGAIGVGALMGSVAFTHVSEKYLNRMPVYCSIVLGISLVIFAQTNVLWASFLAVLPASASLMLGGASANTIVQTRARPDMRVRMVSFYTMGFIGALPWGALAFGALADYIGISAALTVGGTVCALLGMRAYVGRRLAGRIRAA